MVNRKTQCPGEEGKACVCVITGLWELARLLQTCLEAWLQIYKVVLKPTTCLLPRPQNRAGKGCLASRGSQMLVPRGRLNVEMCSPNEEDGCGIYTNRLQCSQLSTGLLPQEELIVPCSKMEPGGRGGGGGGGVGVSVGVG